MMTPQDAGADPYLALVERCRRGDDLAWEQLVRGCQGRVYGLAWHCLRKLALRGEQGIQPARTSATGRVRRSEYRW